MSTWTIEADDIENLLEGLAIMGNGGGGNPSWGRQILQRDIRQGRSWRIMDPASVPDDWTVVSGGMLGSVRTLEGMDFAEILDDWESAFLPLEAVRVLESVLGRSVNAFAPFEPGGLNAPVVMTLSGRSDIVAIDGDGLGRACPESQMTSFIGNGVSLTPMSFVDRVGDSLVILKDSGPVFADELGRWIVARGVGIGADCMYAMSGSQLKEAVVPGTFSGALRIGRAIHHARVAGSDTIEAACGVLGARELFRGRIDAVRDETHLGFYLTTVSLIGDGRSSGQLGGLVIKNEAMLALVDGRVRAMFPDSIFMLDPRSGRGYMSVELEVGMDVAVLGAPANPRLRASAASAIGLISMGPARFGHPELKYIPLEALGTR